MVSAPMAKSSSGSMMGDVHSDVSLLCLPVKIMAIPVITVGARTKAVMNGWIRNTSPGLMSLLVLPGDAGENRDRERAGRRREIEM